MALSAVQVKISLLSALRRFCFVRLSSKCCLDFFRSSAYRKVSLLTWSCETGKGFMQSTNKGGLLA